MDFSDVGEDGREIDFVLFLNSEWREPLEVAFDSLGRGSEDGLTPVVGLDGAETAPAAVVARSLVGVESIVDVLGSPVTEAWVGAVMAARSETCSSLAVEDGTEPLERLSTRRGMLDEEKKASVLDIRELKYIPADTLSLGVFELPGNVANSTRRWSVELSGLHHHFFS